MSTTPRIRAKDGKVTLVRSVHPGVNQYDKEFERESTVRFTTGEWWLIVRTVFADYGLTLESDARERVDRAYQEAENLHMEITRLNQEIEYLTTGEDADGESEEVE